MQLTEKQERNMSDCEASVRVRGQSLGPSLLVSEPDEIRRKKLLRRWSVSRIHSKAVLDERRAFCAEFDTHLPEKVHHVLKDLRVVLDFFQSLQSSVHTYETTFFLKWSIRVVPHAS